MVLKNGNIIPFIFNGEKKLVTITCSRLSRKVSFLDIQLAIYAAFPNFKGKCEFYNKKIGFLIPDKMLVPYLDQRLDLTNFVIEIIEINEEDAKECNSQHNNSTKMNQKLTNKTNKRNESEMSATQIKKLKPDSVDCHLESVLAKSIKGEEICEHFAISKCLNDEDRRLLVDLVISSEFNDVLEYKTIFAIDAKRLKELATAISRWFPTEDTSIYFDEEFKAFKYISDGILYECFLTKKINLIEEGEKNESYLNLDEKAIEANFPELVELQKFKGDFDCFFKAWQCTFPLRNQYFRISIDPTGCFEKFISHFYDKTNDLVEYDFKRFHPDKSKNLFKNWSHMSEKIITEVLFMELKDVPLIMDLYASMPDLSSLMILSYFLANYEREIPPQPFKKDNPENLIIHIEKTIEYPEEFFENYAEVYNLSKPLIFATGKITDRLNFYVLVGFNIFKMENVLKAVDFCFKCYKTLQLSFNSDQFLSWKVIQSAFYDIFTNDDCPLTEKILTIFRNS